MANHKSAIKRHRQSLKRKDRNHAIKARFRTITKKVLNMTDKDEAAKLLPFAVSVLHKAAQKNVLHKNTANRRISKITRYVASL